LLRYFVFSSAVGVQAAPQYESPTNTKIGDNSHYLRLSESKDGPLFLQLPTLTRSRAASTSKTTPASCPPRASVSSGDVNRSDKVTPTRNPVGDMREVSTWLLALSRGRRYFFVMC